MADDLTETTSFSTAKRFGRGLSATLGIVCLLAIVVMVNYLGSGWYQRWDLSQDNRFALSPMTERLLDTLTNDVEVVVCFDVDSESEVFGWTKSLLEEYAHRSPRVHVATVDSARSPGLARQVITDNKLATLRSKNFVVFNSEGHRKVVFASELSDYDRGSQVNGEIEFRRIGFKGELAFSSAIFAVTYPRQQKAYFVTGHNEMDPATVTGDLGYGAFATMLSDECNVEWAKLNLRGTNDLSDASMLIFAGSNDVGFERGELEKIHAYLRQGGRALFLMNNMGMGRPSGIEYYLTNWNVVVQYGLVRDPESVTTGNDLLTARINADHAITRSLAAGDPPMPIRLVAPRMVQPMSKSGSASGIKTDELAWTSDKGIECHVQIDRGVVSTNCMTTNIPLVMAVEQGGIAGVSADRGAMRMVVIGDTYCFNNQLLDSAANRYFAGFVVNWLLDRPQAMLQIPPKPVKEYRLVMSAADERRLSWILLGGMPGGALLLGGLVWLKRRR